MLGRPDPAPILIPVTLDGEPVVITAKITSEPSPGFRIAIEVRATEPPEPWRQ